MSLQLEIVTPHGKVYDEEIDSVVMPTTSGEVGIMPGHIPLLTEIQAGEIAVSKSGTVDHLAVSKGFAQCIGDKVSILAENAISESDIDESEVEAAMARAQEALKNAKEMSAEELAQLETTIQYANIQQLLKKKK
ncbi:ATP synthase F1 subunit epsilon [Pelagicoccus sp. NFK12]|uniref:ATP synthase epsilon chain n=1 Tax=Pelagicoccus enzymogenes TaxID=2773457 RepID=A0A927FAT6_9BACT|nr:ATP synthase F1 subunit epsilon [Pelagicoccus enzymogenes]MBD5781009.1 ATP synthase F1 subunit epsilon [Pelagicoccus enzymogenes]MDQ8198698.1 ATP synthase F1 subunit epsilon [Pelagicoccus enzymogenes]